MKILRAGAFAGSLLLAPQIALAEESAVWTSAQPVWQASPPDASRPVKPPTWTRQWIEAIAHWITAPFQETTAGSALRKAEIELPVEWHNGSGPANEVAPRFSPTSLNLILPFASKRPVAEAKVVVQRPDFSTTGNENIEPPPDSVPEKPVEGIWPPEPGAKILPPSGAKAPPAAIGRPARRPNLLFPHLFGRDRAVASTSAADPASESDSFVRELRDPRLSMSAEYLMWWASNDHVPVLASTGTPQSGGILGNPGTRALFGGGPVNFSDRQGARIRAMLWLDDQNTWGVDGSYMFFGERALRYIANSNTNPVISRPVFVLNNRAENAETVTLPGFSTGSLEIESVSRFWSMDVNIFKRVCTTDDRTVDIFLGYRHLDLAEKVEVQEFIVAGAAAPDPVGTQTNVRDRFSTHNRFNGGQLGTRIEQRWGNWFANVRASIALGDNDQSLQIAGSQVQTVPGQPAQTFQGGLLAARSNIGNFEKHVFSVAPEVGVNVGYQIAPRLRVFAGYNFLYWTNVVRAGEQIDRTVDLTQIPNTPAGVLSSGQRRPGVLFHETGFLVHGVSFGVQWAW